MKLEIQESPSLALRGRQALYLTLVAVFWAVMAAGCSFDTRQGQAQRCSPDFPCPSDQICVEGMCRARDQQPLSDAAEDGAGDDGGPADAGVDTGGADVVEDGGGADTTVDAAADVAEDTGDAQVGDAADAADADADTSADAGSDATTDAGVDADTSPDSGADAGPDTGSDTGADSGTDAGTDADTGGCANPQPEICDGLDNDCDGQVDNATQQAGESCDTGAQGICGQGVKACTNGHIVCEPTTTATNEVCNGLDDDCDGQIDEDAVQVGDACQTGLAGNCAAGEFRCHFGQLECNPIQGPVTEVCDGEDDDCDGQVDEDFPQKDDPCQTGQPGQCADGSKQCVQGQISCEPLTPAVAETCDGVDNDCDDLIDEDANGMALAVSCGAASCPGRGVSVCVGAQWSACQEDSREICDGVDNNCDSVADNQTPCYQVCPGGDVAVGTLDCTTGSGACILPDEICNDGVDNNCDGQIDEGCSNGNVRDNMVYVPGGPFWMGSQNSDWGAQQDETPQHLVELDAFYIDRTEVNRRQYRACVAGGGCSVPGWGCAYQGVGSSNNYLDKPIGCIDSSQAAAYCQWAGKRLPTEAEWEKAARGPYPRKNLFPWGDTADTSKAVVDCSNGLNGCVAESQSYPQGASYYGALHMAGNVAEWVTDYYDPNFYTSQYTVAPEQTTDQGDGPVVRGGSYDQTIRYARVANRAALTFGSVVDDAVGLRCALDAP